MTSNAKALVKLNELSEAFATFRKAALEHDLEMADGILAAIDEGAKAAIKDSEDYDLKVTAPFILGMAYGDSLDRLWAETMKGQDPVRSLVDAAFGPSKAEAVPFPRLVMGRLAEMLIHGEVPA